MSDLQEYISQRTAHDPDFAEGFEAGYGEFKIGVILRRAREAAGLTQEQVARQLGTQTVSYTHLYWRSVL